MKNTIKILLGLALAVIGSQAQALTVSGDCNNTTNTDSFGNTCYWADPNDPSQPTVSEIEALVGATDLLELYKIDFDTLTEERPFADSYTTTFNVVDSDDGVSNAGGEIAYDFGNPSISCPDCFLLVKDGDQTPAWFVFDLGDWSGTTSIFMEDFWLGKGGISNVVIYGNISNVPEPGMVSLLAIGLIGMVVTRRRMKV